MSVEGYMSLDKLMQDSQTRDALLTRSLGPELVTIHSATGPWQKYTLPTGETKEQDLMEVLDFWTADVWGAAFGNPVTQFLLGLSFGAFGHSHAVDQAYVMAYNRAKERADIQNTIKAQIFQDEGTGKKAEADKAKSFSIAMAMSDIDPVGSYKAALELGVSPDLYCMKFLHDEAKKNIDTRSDKEKALADKLKEAQFELGIAKYLIEHGIAQPVAAPAGAGVEPLYMSELHAKVDKIGNGLYDLGEKFERFSKAPAAVPVAAPIDYDVLKSGIADSFNQKIVPLLNTYLEAEKAMHGKINDLEYGLNKVSGDVTNFKVDMGYVKAHLDKLSD